MQAKKGPDARRWARGPQASCRRCGWECSQSEGREEGASTKSASGKAGGSGKGWGEALETGRREELRETGRGALGRLGRAKSGGGVASRSGAWGEPGRVEDKGKDQARGGKGLEGEGAGGRGRGRGARARAQAGARALAARASGRTWGRCRGRSGPGAAALSEAHGDCVL